jgi:hypothetical protein
MSFIWMNVRGKVGPPEGSPPEGENPARGMQTRFTTLREES